MEGGRCGLARRRGDPYGSAMGERSFTEQVWQIVRQVPHGKVVSYGGVAAIMGRPRAARGVGKALNALPEDTDVPWWRVINSRGEISIRGHWHGAALQRALLRDEGIEFGRDGRVDFEDYGWWPGEEVERLD